MSKKFSKYFILLLLLNLIWAMPAQAICPVCTIAVCAGIGFSRWLGIDDTITGAWIGGLIVSIIIWFLNWLNKKKIHFKFRNFFVSVLTYLIVILPLYFLKILGHPLNKFLFMDKILFGIISGSLFFGMGVWLHNFLKKKNNGKSFFPFQKVVIPISFLVIISLIFYFLIKIKCLI